ncbi:MAG TPA: FAD-binding oxidoreductase, partial [Alphaproteobacteria bacterium]|nr:FAD-binding oxidoreductase [Alphaproteobacteria bacterium]
GIIGSSIAYQLAKNGMKDVVVIEKDYISSGATGRCGAGVRQQWGTEMNCRLSKGSVDIFENLSEELGMDIEFRQGGYLSLIENDFQREQTIKNIKLQNSLNIPSKIISREEAKAIVPQINTDKFIAAAFCETDGHANPFLTNFAYYKAAERLGVVFEKKTEVVGVDIEGDSKRVVTDKGSITTRLLVNAAGGFSREVAGMVGIKLPTFAERHQILVTEPLERLFDCMVISFMSGIYLQQVPHGSFVMGIGEKEEPSHNINSSWQFLEHFSSIVTELIPMMKNIRIVRQWAGSYNKTPDAQPIIGEHEYLKGFYNAVGFSGHGFMLAPIVSKLMMQIIMGKSMEIDISSLTALRFERGELIKEPSVVG